MVAEVITGGLAQNISSKVSPTWKMLSWKCLTFTFIIEWVVLSHTSLADEVKFRASYVGKISSIRIFLKIIIIAKKLLDVIEITILIVYEC